MVRVLVVDDAADVRALVRGYLSGVAEVVPCAQQDAAVAAFTAEPCELALVDLVLGDESGFDVLAALRALPGGAAARIVAMSANAAPADREASRRAGFDDHLAKPLDRARVRAAILAPRLGLDLVAPLPARAAAPASDPAVERDPTVEAMLPELLAAVAASTRTLPGHLAAGAHDAVRRVGHRVAGSGALLGYHAIGELGRALEHAAIARDQPAMQRLGAALCRDVDAALAALERRRNHG